MLEPMKKPAAFVRIANLQTETQLSLAAIRRLTIRALAILGQSVEVRVAFVSDPEIKKINQLFHSRNRVTDVLAFELPSAWPQGPKQKTCLGEVVVSVDRILANATRFRVSSSEELMRCIVHGLLHLLGERDQSPALRSKMVRRQEALLLKLRPLGTVIH